MWRLVPRVESVGYSSPPGASAQLDDTEQLHMPDGSQSHSVSPQPASFGKKHASPTAMHGLMSAGCEVGQVGSGHDSATHCQVSFSQVHVSPSQLSIIW